MIYSAACAYAIRAMSHLAAEKPEGYLLLEDLCEGTDLPRHFVAKILQDLVRRELLTSAKGRGGGFALARPPNTIRLYDIVAAVDGIKQFNECVVGLAECDEHQPCPLHDHWKNVRKVIESFLLETTLAQMSTTLQSKLERLGQALPER